MGRVFWAVNLKTGVDFVHFLSGIGYGFQGNYRIVQTYLLVQFQMSKKEREIREFEMDQFLTNLFCCCSNLSYEDISS